MVSSFLIKTADNLNEAKEQITETQDMIEKQTEGFINHMKHIQMGNKTISQFILDQYGYGYQEAPAPSREEP